jgi:hypothetical protein
VENKCSQKSYKASASVTSVKKKSEAVGNIEAVILEFLYVSKM